VELRSCCIQIEDPEEADDRDRQIRVIFGRIGRAQARKGQKCRPGESGGGFALRMSEAENQSGSRAGGLERNEAVVVAAVAAADGNGVDNVTDNGAGGASVAIATEDSGENRPFQARNRASTLYRLPFLSYQCQSIFHLSVILISVSAGKLTEGKRTCRRDPVRIPDESTSKVDESERR